MSGTLKPSAHDPLGQAKLSVRPQLVQLADGDVVGLRDAFRAECRVGEVLLHIGLDAGDQGLVGDVVPCHLGLADRRDDGPR